jgi:hypothetical protein
LHLPYYAAFDIYPRSNGSAQQATLAHFQPGRYRTWLVDGKDFGSAVI